MQILKTSTTLFRVNCIQIKKDLYSGIGIKNGTEFKIDLKEVPKLFSEWRLVSFFMPILVQQAERIHKVNN